jgi:hypothetical protein
MHVEVPAQRVRVEAEQSAARRLRHVPVEAAQAPQVRAAREGQRQDEAAQHRHQREVVLLRRVQAHGVHVVQGREDAAFSPREEPSQRTSDTCIQSAHGAPEEPLRHGRREQALPGGKRRELRVAREDGMQIGRAAAGHAEHEERGADLDLFIAAEEQLIEQEAEPVQSLHHREQRDEAEHDQHPPHGDRACAVRRTEQGAGRHPDESRCADQKQMKHPSGVGPGCRLEGPRRHTSRRCVAVGPPYYPRRCGNRNRHGILVHLGPGAGAAAAGAVRAGGNARGTAPVAPAGAQPGPGRSPAASRSG